MPGPIAPAGIHHLRLTVTDVRRSREFYTGLLGFQVAVESPPPGDPSEAAVFGVLFGGVVMVRGDIRASPTVRSPGWNRSASTCCPSKTPMASSWSSPRRSRRAADQRVRPARVLACAASCHLRLLSGPGRRVRPSRLLVGADQRVSTSSRVRSTSSTPQPVLAGGAEPDAPCQHGQQAYVTRSRHPAAGTGSPHEPRSSPVRR